MFWKPKTFFGSSQHDVSAALQLAVRREDVGDVDLAVVERLVLQPDRQRSEVDVSDPVDAREADEARLALAELRRRAEPQARDPREVGDVSEVVSLAYSGSTASASTSLKASAAAA